MKIWIQMTTLTILMLCDFSCRAYANGSSSSEDSTENSSEEPTGSNSGSDADEFINNVPDDFKINFVTEEKKGKSKVVFQPGERKCMKALTWLEETYTGNISMINTLVKYNIASCNAIPPGKSYCGRNTLGHTRSFKTKCHQCAKGCKDVLGGGTRYISCNPDDCKSAKEECEILSCVSNATCVFVENSYKCHCPDGFKGTNCNVDINECASSPCQNGATCIDHINGYECNCTTGFQGTDCDVDINECASSPCQNGATCINHINRYECNCTTGFQGTDCDAPLYDHPNGEGPPSPKPTFKTPCGVHADDVSLNLTIPTRKRGKVLVAKWQIEERQKSCGTTNNTLLVELKDLDGCPVDSAETSFTDLTAAVGRKIVRQIKPNSLYKVTLSVAYGGGEFYNKSDEIRTLETEPTSAPENLMVEEVERSTGMLKFQWTEPPCGGRNGVITNFWTSFTINGHEREDSTEETSKTFFELTEGDIYTFKVKAETRYGRGPYTEPGCTSVFGTDICEIV